jgi:hypothetical protein
VHSDLDSAGKIKAIHQGEGSRFDGSEMFPPSLSPILLESPFAILTALALCFGPEQRLCLLQVLGDGLCITKSWCGVGQLLGEVLAVPPPKSISESGGLDNGIPRQTDRVVALLCSRGAAPVAGCRLHLCHQSVKTAALSKTLTKKNSQGLWRRLGFSGTGSRGLRFLHCTVHEGS